MSSRLQMTAKNAFWSYFSMFASLAIQFISRTIFIYCLGESYLGINGLFANVLGVLSFAELGIGTAMNFSLYKPVAEHDIEKIKAYMHCYKWAYRAVAGVITVLGLLLVPFLPALVKDPGNIGNLTAYYLIFLLDTVTSYFVSYKYSLVNAEQKNYIYTNANLIISLTKTVVQIIVLLVWKNYFLYLTIGLLFSLFQKIFVARYLDSLHPYLKDKHVEKLGNEEKQLLVQKIKALVIHKIGDISVHQTDNIIVSACLTVRLVGRLSNYNLIINTVRSCITILFNSVTGSLGNLIATESKDKQYDVFCKYRFIGFWFYGFTSIALMVLLSPFIRLWIGDGMVVDEAVIALIMIDYYMIGHRICLNNIKSAAGVFEVDKYVALIQAAVNLVASIALVKIIGLPGVYLGTIMQGMISSVLKPILVYQPMFHKSSRLYFIDSAKFLAAVLLALVPCWIARSYLLTELTILRFAALILVVIMIPNAVFYAAFHRREEFLYVKNILISIMKRGRQ